MAIRSFSDRRWLGFLGLRILGTWGITTALVGVGIGVGLPRTVAQTPPPADLTEGMLSPSSTGAPASIADPAQLPTSIVPIRPAVPFGHLPVDRIWSDSTSVEPSVPTSLSVEPTQPGGMLPMPDSPPLVTPLVTPVVPVNPVLVKPIEEPIHLIVRRGKRRVEVYRGDKQVASYPIAVGKAGWETPIGNFAVISKEENPIFKSFKTGNVIEPGPDNPLGVRWIGIWTDGKTQIGFHGTNQPELIGKAVSHGCIRMHNKDVVALYQYVTLGTPVTVKP